MRDSRAPLASGPNSSAGPCPKPLSPRARPASRPPGLSSFAPRHRHLHLGLVRLARATACPHVGRRSAGREASALAHRLTSSPASPDCRARDARRRIIAPAAGARCPLPRPPAVVHGTRSCRSAHRCSARAALDAGGTLAGYCSLFRTSCVRPLHARSHSSSVHKRFPCVAQSAPPRRGSYPSSVWRPASFGYAYSSCRTRASHRLAVGFARRAAGSGPSGSRHERAAGM